MRAKLGRPKGAPVRCDLDAAEALRWWSLDLTTGRLVWRTSPGGGVPAGSPAGVSVTLAGARYRSNRIAVLLATGSWPAAGRTPIDPLAAVRGERVSYAVETPQQRMLALVRSIVEADPTAWQVP